MSAALYHWWADCSLWPLDDNGGEAHRIAMTPDQVTCTQCLADSQVDRRSDDD